MEDIELVIKISEKAYNALTHTEFDANLVVDEMRKSIAHGTPLPKGHGRLIDADALEYDKESVATDSNIEYYVIGKEDIDATPTVIEADKEYEVEVVSRGNCMICGKELTEGLFFCKECEDKASSRK